MLGSPLHLSTPNTIGLNDTIFDCFYFSMKEFYVAAECLCFKKDDIVVFVKSSSYVNLAAF